MKDLACSNDLVILCKDERPTGCYLAPGTSSRGGASGLQDPPLPHASRKLKNSNFLGTMTLNVYVVYLSAEINL